MSLPLTAFQGPPGGPLAFQRNAFQIEPWLDPGPASPPASWSSDSQEANSWENQAPTSAGWVEDGGKADSWTKDPSKVDTWGGADDPG